MARLKLPRPPHFASPALPPEVFAEAEAALQRSAVILLTRREFLKATAVASAALALPWHRLERVYAAGRGRFFTRSERAALEALCDRIIPPDGDPGAKALGAALYIEELLTALDGTAERIYAGGPFSGRTPYPDTVHGRPGRRRPRNSFRSFIPLTRLQRLRWRAELFGSADIAELAAIDQQLGGPLVGLRSIYRDGLAHLDEVARAMQGASFARLSADKRDALLTLLLAAPPPVGFARDGRRGDTFLDLAIRHTIEGCFAAPEYGGNHGKRGWRLVGLEGDSQPLGYSVFSTQQDAYRELKRHPMSTANPDELARDGTLRPQAISSDGQKIQDTIVATTKGFEPIDCA